MTLSALVSILFLFTSASLAWYGIVLHRQRKRRRERLQLGRPRAAGARQHPLALRSIPQAPFAAGKP
jgi:hypothetical protein